MPEMKKSLESNNSKITKDENSENLPRLENAEVLLKHFNTVKKDYQQHSRVLYTFVTNKSFDISPKSFIFFKKTI